MTERDKIINIVEQNKYCDVNTVANCRECKYSKELENYKDMGCSSLKTADALIDAGFGGVKDCREYYKQAHDVAQRAFHIWDETFVKLWETETQKEEAEHRAEVAERALLRLCEETMRDKLIIMYPVVGRQVRDKQELYDYCIEQAERELAEERKDG